MLDAGCWIFSESLVTSARIHEFAGEPVEEFGMGWGIDAGAEVFGCGDDALAEIFLPDAIDDDASGGGRARVHNPFGEAEAVGGSAVRQGVEKRGNARCDFVAGAK